MPPGNSRIQKTTKVVEKVTAEACIAIARRVAQTRERAGDGCGSAAAEQIAQLVEKELLGPARTPRIPPVH
jgi:hypothetical protein